MHTNIPNLERLEEIVGSIILCWTVAESADRNRIGSLGKWPGTAILWGPPGVGKTTAAWIAAKVLAATPGDTPLDSLQNAVIRVGSGQLDEAIQTRDADYLSPPEKTEVQWEIRPLASLSTLDATDFAGAPVVIQTTSDDSPRVRLATVLARPALLPPLPENPQESKQYVCPILIVEDLSAATQRTTMAAAPLLMGTPSRTASSIDLSTMDVAPYELPPHTKIVGDSNLGSVLGTTHVNSAVRNRAIHFGMGINPVAPEIASNPNVRLTPEFLETAHPLVRIFLSYGNGVLQCQDEQMEDRIAFPTLRSWSMVSAACFAVDELKKRASSLGDAEQKLFIQRLNNYWQNYVCGAVGREVGIPFLTFTMSVTQGLPSIELILANPDTAPLPDTDSLPKVMYTLYMLANGIRTAVRDRSTLHLPPEQRPEGRLIRYCWRMLMEKPSLQKFAEVVAAINFMLARGLSYEEAARLQPFDDMITQIMALATGNLKIEQ